MKPFSSLAKPLAITMWDFSWLERRWPGAGYEDWDLILDELVERGYDAVRIDAYPHLLAAGPGQEWEILPPWNQQDWGSPARVRVRVMPALTDFIAKCAARGVRVGLSTWFQDDTTGQRLLIASPRAHADIWIATLRQIEQAGLLASILYLDFSNEWPNWAQFFQFSGADKTDWRHPESLAWMRETTDRLRQSYPQLPLTYSFSSHHSRNDVAGVDVSFLDFIEPHQWMAGCTGFYQRVGYQCERFESKGYENVVARAEALYRSDPGYWQQRLSVELDALSDWGAESGKALVTTEGWSIVDYKDWPGLDWEWVKDLSAWAVRYVAAKGTWAAICTSNFCGPQFRGMWRDVAWHQRLTRLIHEAPLPAALGRPGK